MKTVYLSGYVDGITAEQKNRFNAKVSGRLRCALGLFAYIFSPRNGFPSSFCVSICVWLLPLSLSHSLYSERSEFSAYNYTKCVKTLHECVCVCAVQKLNGRMQAFTNTRERKKLDRKNAVIPAAMRIRPQTKVMRVAQDKLKGRYDADRPGPLSSLYSNLPARFFVRWLVGMFVDIVVQILRGFVWNVQIPDRNA